MLASKYNYVDSIIDLVQFVIYTEQQIKVRYFSILSVGDTVLEIGLEILRCSSIYQQILSIINGQYQIQQINEYQSHLVTFKFKDSQSQYLFSTEMDLKKPQDLIIYNQVNQLYQRYQHFIKQCYERLSFYIYFLRSKTLFMIDFDKQGRLRFLNQALPQKIKQQFNIDKTQIGLTYKQIFNSNQSMIQTIETYFSNSKWKLNQQEVESNKIFEILIRKEEKQFKGFTLIVSENDWVRRKAQPLNSGNLVKQQLLQTETMDYIKKLEEFNPDIRYSVVAMQMPQTQEFNSIQQQSQKTPTLVFRKIKKDLVVGKNSFLFKQREEEKKSMKVNPNKFNESHLSIKEQDIILDSLDFNIDQINNMIEQQRLVWSRGNFIQMFGIPSEKLVTFLNELETQYNMNNKHNIS